jgi:hypothetical protein
MMAKDEDDNPIKCECRCGHSSETDAGPSSQMIEEEKRRKGITPEMERRMEQEG